MRVKCGEVLIEIFLFLNTTTTTVYYKVEYVYPILYVQEEKKMKNVFTKHIIYDPVH